MRFFFFCCIHGSPDSLSVFLIKRVAELVFGYVAVNYTLNSTNIKIEIVSQIKNIHNYRNSMLLCRVIFHIITRNVNKNIHVIT